MYKCSLIVSLKALVLEFHQYNSFNSLQCFSAVKPTAQFILEKTSNNSNKRKKKRKKIILLGGYSFILLIFNVTNIHRPSFKKHLFDQIFPKTVGFISSSVFKSQQNLDFIYLDTLENCAINIMIFFFKECCRQFFFSYCTFQVVLLMCQKS